MDEESYSVKAVKPFRNAHNKFEKTINYKSQAREKVFEPLTTKNAVKFLLEGTLKYKVCRYCLNVASRLSELDEIFEVGRKGAIYKVTLRDMIASVHPFKVIDDPNFPDKLCGTCVESAISAYLFAQQCEKAERALRNCFEDIYDKFEKLDPLERGKKRGRQKANPNTNILYTEHEIVTDYAEPIINIINLGSTAIAQDGQINELECPKCWQVLPNVEALLNHDNIHPKNMWFNCKLCGQSFVKQRHYKRHIKDVHQHGSIILERTNTNFKCNECSFMSSNVSQHLQHMEKHKFKTTFKHLIDRKMDQICAMCLEKGTCMVHLNESIHLSGGYPGLNNEQTIYNIVSSTFPERKSYKYQELLIPTRANIMTITKRMDVSQAKNFTAIYDKDKKMFRFCNPIIVSTLNIEFDTLYIFILAEPYMLSEVGFKINYNSLVNNGNISSTTSNAKISKNFNIVAELDSKTSLSTNINNSTCKEIAVDGNLQTNCDKNIEVISKDAIFEDPQRNIKLCKTCWIFDKPSCKECIDKLQNPIIDNMEMKDIKTVKQVKCNNCWLFESVGKCNTCKKILKSDIGNNTQNNLYNQMNTIDVEQNYNNNQILEYKIFKYDIGPEKPDSNDNNDHVPEYKIITEYDTVLEKPDMKSTVTKDTRKRKSDLEVSVTRKLQWQCRICLTNNYENRETCFCCEFDTCKMDSKVKFNFGKNNIFFETPKVEDETPKTQESNENKEATVMKDIGNAKLLATNFQKPEISNTENADICMDVEMNTNETETTLEKFNPFTKDESMDICYEEETSNTTFSFSTKTQVFNTSINMPIQSAVNIPFKSYIETPFKFNIGSSATGTTIKEKYKRNIRPLRRMANKGHK